METTNSTKTATAILDIYAVQQALDFYADAAGVVTSLTEQSDPFEFAGQEVPAELAAKIEQATAEFHRTFAVLRDVIEAHR